METDQPPFPKDVELEIEMLDDTPIPIPEDCPEGGCDVVCHGWFIGGAAPVATNNITSGANFVPMADFVDGVGTAYATNGVSFYVPVGQFCGHKLRFTFVDGAVPDDYTVQIISDDALGDVGLRLHVDQLNATAGAIIGLQIDSTDADPGEETWTDLCGQITFIAIIPP